MKKRSFGLIVSGYVFVLAAMCFTSSAAARPAHLIDHSFTDLSAIPAQWINKAKSKLHIAYNHTSHGSQIISGMNALESFPEYNGLYSWADDSHGTATALSLDDMGIPGVLDISRGDTDGDHDGISQWAEDTYTFLNASENYHINVVMWSWCSIAGHNIQHYLDSMEWLISQFGEGGTNSRAAAHPVQFVFMTGHAEGGGEGDASDSRNELIRAHCAAHDRILFDFADIENYDPDNNYFLNKKVNDSLYYDSDGNGSRDANWAQNYLTRHDDNELDRLTTGTNVPGYSGCPACAHSEGPSHLARLNCVLKARAAWHLFAELAGWGQAAPSTTVYEDAEDLNTAGWNIYDGDPAGASISNIEDPTSHSRVIKLDGEGVENGYRLRNPDGSNWNNTQQSIFGWSMKFTEKFIVYVQVQTTDGLRYLYYTASDHDNLGAGTYIHHGLGNVSNDGNWHTVICDLENDLHEAQPENAITSILGFYVRGTGRVDNIKAFDAYPTDIDFDLDGLTDIDEINLYGTDPLIADSDADGLNDGAERDFWGDSWGNDADGDGIINILDKDSDNDSILDGVEVAQNTDPADPDSVSSIITYEDAEDNNIVGWSIYDNTPTGATITNVFDNERNSRVIKLAGAGLDNGYALRNADNSNWDNGIHTMIEWSMAFSERYVIYVAVQTTDGLKYLYYTASDHDNLGGNTYIHHGLGENSKNGNWHTYERDLAFDLYEAQPEVNLEKILGFYVRGSGRVDDIETMEMIPVQ